MTLRYIILGLLCYMPMTGYDLKIFMDKSINFFWSAELSQIYRELSKLESLNYINSKIEHQEGRPDKKIYSITQEGYEAFIEWLKDFPSILSSPSRNEFLVRVFFGAKLSKEEMILLFENYIKEINKELKTYESIDKDLNQRFASSDFKMNNDYLYQNLTLKRGTSWCNAELNWAKDCINTIKEFYIDKTKTEWYYFTQF